jgi:cobalt-zinc-cadmium efflux system protein
MAHDHQGHDHDHRGALACGVAGDEQTGARLAFAAGLTALIFVAELIGGLLTGSLALLSDAAHVFSDVLALLLSYGAHRLARRAPSATRTYGWHRVEVFAAIVNGLTLVVIGIGIIREAYGRLVAPPSIHVGPMLIVAVCGLVANAIVLLRLGGHGHSDLNLRGAYLHVLGDLLASVGVVIAAVVMRLTGFYLIDPILSVLIALAIIYSSLRLLREGAHILLEGVPHGVKLEDIAEILRELPGVQEVHHVHAWSICSNVHALSAHLVTCSLDDASREALVNQANELVAERFGIAETTFQIETQVCIVGSDVLHAATHTEAESVANGRNRHHH